MGASVVLRETTDIALLTLTQYRPYSSPSIAVPRPLLSAQVQWAKIYVLRALLPSFVREPEPESNPESVRGRLIASHVPILSSPTHKGSTTDAAQTSQHTSRNQPGIAQTYEAIESSRAIRTARTSSLSRVYRAPVLAFVPFPLLCASTRFAVSRHPFFDRIDARPPRH